MMHLNVREEMAQDITGYFLNTSIMAPSWPKCRSSDNVSCTCHDVLYWVMDKSGYTHPSFRQVGGGKMQTSSPPVITPNRSQSNPDDRITLPRPIQSVGMNLQNVSGTSTGQTLPRERRAPRGTHFCPTVGWVYPHSATIFNLHPLCPLFHPLLSEIYVPASPDQGHDRLCRRGVGRVFLAGVRPDSPSRRRIPSCYRPVPGRGVVVELGQRSAH